MFLGFDIGASCVKAVLLDGDDRAVAIADADLPGQMRGATLDAVGRRARRGQTFQPDAARAATITAGFARWRRLALFAKEISQ